MKICPTWREANPQAKLCDLLTFLETALEAGPASDEGELLLADWESPDGIVKAEDCPDDSRIEDYIDYVSGLIDKHGADTPISAEIWD